MSFESVRAWLSEHAPDLPIIETPESTATVDLAAEAVALLRARRGAGGVIFGGVGEDGELLLGV